MEGFSSNSRVSMLLSNLTVVIRVKPDDSKIGVDGDRLVEHENSLRSAYQRYSNGDSRTRTAAKIKENVEELYGYATLYMDSITLNRVFVQDRLTSDEDNRFEQLHAHTTEVVEKMTLVMHCLDEINQKTYAGRMPELDTLSTGFQRRLECMRAQLQQLRTQKDCITVQLPLARCTAVVGGIGTGTGTVAPTKSSGTGTGNGAASATKSGTGAGAGPSTAVRTKSVQLPAALIAPSVPAIPHPSPILPTGTSPAALPPTSTASDQATLPIATADTTVKSTPVSSVARRLPMPSTAWKQASALLTNSTATSSTSPSGSTPV